MSALDAARRQGYARALREVVELCDEQLEFLVDRWPPDMEVRSATVRHLRAMVLVLAEQNECPRGDRGRRV